MRARLTSPRMSERASCRRRARAPAPEPREAAHAPEPLAVSPLAAFLDDAEAALCELRDLEPTPCAAARERSE
jgi:hypothetical protein